MGKRTEVVSQVSPGSRTKCTMVVTEFLVQDNLRPTPSRTSEFPLPVLL